MTHACGCVNAPDSASGVLRSVSKCEHHTRHQRQPSTLGEEYYRELGGIGDGTAQRRHREELAEALGTFPAGDGKLAVEIGCGLSGYCPALLAAGFQYRAIEASLWAAEWMRREYGVPVIVGGYSIEMLPPCDLIVAAHVIEHLPDAPQAIRELVAGLESGGRLYIVVPDDSDPVNPDHLYFFTADSLRSVVEASGATVERLEVRSVVPQENFIYCLARKP